MKKSAYLIFIFVIAIQIQSLAHQSRLAQSANYATREQATKLLSVEDAYIQGLGQFDIESKAQNKKASLKDLKKLTIESILEWDEDERTKIQTQLVAIDSTLNSMYYHLNMPSEIVFIKSTMQDEGRAAGYTRGHSIVLKEGVSYYSDMQLRELLLHELFHVLSRHDARLRKDLYQLIGFTICNEIKLPIDLKNKKISNPDAPFKDSYITLAKGDTTIECMMYLYSKRPYQGGSFFTYLSIGLVVLQGDVQKEIALRNGQPIIYTTEEVENFAEQIGQNTAYIIDPEEVMADNFMHAVLQAKDKPSMDLIRKIQHRLAQH